MVGRVGRGGRGGRNRKWMKGPRSGRVGEWEYAGGARNKARGGFEVGSGEQGARGGRAGNGCEKNAKGLVNGATGTATSVGVDLSILRDAHVDDGCDIGDIQPAGCDVSGDQAGDRAFAEGVECARPLALY